MWRQLESERASEVKQLVKSSRYMCAGNSVFSHTEGVSESKMACEMLCFTIETAVGGCEGRRCETAVAAMFAPIRLHPRYNGGLDVLYQSFVRIIIGGCNRE